MKRLANHIRVARYQSGGIFGMGSRQKIITDSYYWEAMVALSAEWIRPAKGEDILRAVKDKYPDFDENTLEEALREIEGGNYLFDENAFDPSDRYSRNS
ncbi:MAG: hypothetical protein MO847_12340, partial [Candidatus Protistobacter heckmanni]|nr:hypothetical protein [Candidatus Protistobacter heckmanni]